MENYIGCSACGRGCKCVTNPEERETVGRQHNIPQDFTASTADQKVDSIFGLYIDNGVIKAGEFPVEPEPKASIYADELAMRRYEQALASAKANAVECEDHEEALGAVVVSCPSDCILLRGSLVVGAKDGIYPLPSGWGVKVREVLDSVSSGASPFGSVSNYKKVAKLYRIVQQPEPEESQEALWDEAEGIIAEAMGTYKTSLTVALASYARKELEKHFTITRRK